MSSRLTRRSSSKTSGCHPQDPQRDPTCSVQQAITFETDCVVDLTRDAPQNQLPPTQFAECPVQRRSALRGRTSSVIVINEVIDLSTPTKSDLLPPTRSNKVKKRRLDSSPNRSPKKIETKSADSGLCPICLEKLEFVDPTPQKQVMSTQCGHMYCRSCITSILKQKQACPKCRRRQTLQDIHPLYM